MHGASFPHEPFVDIVALEQLRLLRARDADTFAALVEEWSPAMLRFARTFVRTRQAAEDVVQDTWLGVVAGLDRFEGRSSHRTWVYGILVNQARTAAVRGSRTVSLTDGDVTATTRWSTMADAGPDGDPEQSALQLELTTLLLDVLGTIPPRQALAVTLRDVIGVDAQGACDLMAVSARNQRVLLHRGRAAVREPLRAYLSA